MMANLTLQGTSPYLPTPKIPQHGHLLFLSLIRPVLNLSNRSFLVYLKNKVKFCRTLNAFCYLFSNLKYSKGL